MQKKIIFATHNPHKLHEVQHLLGDQFLLVSLKDIDFTGDIPETKPTLEENALEKAIYIYDKYKIPCFADDTGLEIEALGGEPGVYSARYAGDIQLFGSEKARAEANIDKVLSKLHNKSNRNARFRTVIAFLCNEQEYFFEGIVKGRIIDIRRGTEGFGYDPIFIPEGFDQTFAEMSLSDKNKISHRARAFEKFVNFLKHQNI